MKSNITNYFVITLVIASQFLLMMGCNNTYDGVKSDLIEIFDNDQNYIVRQSFSKNIIFSSEKACEAIQFALEIIESNRGGELFIHPGNYTIYNQIDVPNLTKLRGSGNSTRLIFDSNHNTGIGLMAEEKNKITIKDLWIQSNGDGGRIGIYIDHCGDIKVKGVTVVGTAENGIVMANKTFLSEISGCRIADTGGSGILLKQLTAHGRGGSYVPNLITNNIVYRCGKGIEFERALVVNAIGCLVYQTTGYAFHIHTQSNSILLNGCRTFQIEDDCIRVENSHEIAITGNIFCWHDGHGIVLKDVIWGTITGNNIIDTGNVPFEETKTDEYEYWKDHPENVEEYQRYGIWIKDESSCLTITGNAVFNWASNPPMIDGIFEDNTNSYNLITGNNINGFTGLGVRSQGSNTLSNNNVSSRVAALGNTEKFHSIDPRFIEEFIEDLR